MIMNERNINALPVDQIDASGGRELDMEMVKRIASSIDEVGLQNPIGVVADDAGAYRIIFGRHRLDAVRLLGREHIDARVYRGLSDDEIRLAEIVENLHRAELTALERANQIAEYAALVKKRRKQGGAQVAQHPSNVKGASGREGGDAAAARELGVSRRELKRSEVIANNISQRLQAAAKKAGIDKSQSKLVKLAEAPPERQEILIEELALPKAKKAQVGLRAAKGVNETVNTILHEFGDANVQLIIDGLSAGLAARAVAAELKASVARGVEIERAADDKCVSPPAEPDPESVEEVSRAQHEVVEPNGEEIEPDESIDTERYTEIVEPVDVFDYDLAPPSSLGPDGDDFNSDSHLEGVDA